MQSVCPTLICTPGGGQAKFLEQTSLGLHVTNATQKSRRPTGFMQFAHVADETLSRAVPSSC